MKKGIVLFLLVFSCTAVSSDKLADQAIDCEQAMNTLEINRCAANELSAAELELKRYLSASLERHYFDPSLVAAINSAQAAWQAYKNAHCDAVYTQWREGSIRGVMTLACKTSLVKQRSHELWENFLTYADSTAPVLPEPYLD